MYSLAVTVGMTKQLGDVEMFALIISGLCHDLEHPVGVPALSDLSAASEEQCVCFFARAARVLLQQWHSESTLGAGA